MCRVHFSKIPISAKYVVSRHVRASLIECRGSAGGVTGTGTFVLNELPGGQRTNISWTINISAPAIASPILAVSKGVIEARANAALARLSEVLAA